METKMREHPLFEQCQTCGRAFPVNSNKGSRTPCQTCGSHLRNYSIQLQSSIRAEAYSRRHSKHGKIRSRRRWLLEIINGDDYWRKMRRWTYIHRVIDRLNDWYAERIVDKETGKLIIDEADPLSEHQGHGSAKGKKRVE